MKSSKTISLLITLNLISASMLMGMEGSSFLLGLAQTSRNSAVQTPVAAMQPEASQVDQALANAIQNNNLEAARILIEQHGANPNANLISTDYVFLIKTNKYDGTPNFYKTSSMRALDLVQTVEAAELLHKFGVDIYEKYHTITVSNSANTANNVESFEYLGVPISGSVKDSAIGLSHYRIGNPKNRTPNPGKNTRNALVGFDKKNRAKFNNFCKELNEFGKTLPPVPTFE
jgi:hypothetical protein